MTEKEWMNEGLDLKLLLLLYRKKIWISVVCALAGACFAGGLYFLMHVVYAPAREYEAVSKLYLTFAKDDDGDAYQYYNGYTWNDLMKTEPILDKIMEELFDSTLSREEVKIKITADILSDIRLLTVTVRSNLKEEAEVLIRACEEALVRFGAEQPEFDCIEVIEHGQPDLEAAADETLRAVLAGFVIGFLLSLLGLAFACVLDDSIYVPSDLEKRYDVPVLGVRFAGNETLGKEELLANLAFIKEKKGSVQTVCASSFQTSFAELHFIKEKETSVILEVPYGCGNGKLIGRCMAEAQLLGIGIAGAVITEADERLYRIYFASFHRKKKK